MNKSLRSVNAARERRLPRTGTSERPGERPGRSVDPCSPGSVPVGHGVRLLCALGVLCRREFTTAVLEWASHLVGIRGPRHWRSPPGMVLERILRLSLGCRLTELVGELVRR